jgi:hypothetical protein
MDAGIVELARSVVTVTPLLTGRTSREAATTKSVVAYLQRITLHILVHYTNLARDIVPS